LLFLDRTWVFNSPSSSSLDEKSAEWEGEKASEDIDEGTIGAEFIEDKDGVCRFKKDGNGKDSGSGEYSNAPPAYRCSGESVEGDTERLEGSLCLLGLLVIGMKLVGKGTGRATCVDIIIWFFWIISYWA